MKRLFFAVISLIFAATACNKSSNSQSNPPAGDSATVTVVNGYGSGTYKVGDTVQIWSNALPANTVFDVWTGYNNLLQNSGEWHNTFIMPAQSVTVTATQKAITPYSLTYEKIKGVNILKNVYYYFPTGHKGIVYLLHGTGGSANNLVTTFAWIQMMNDLVAANYAIVVTEAEEISLNTDLNSDGKLRWLSTPLDSTSNVDYGNIKALRDTFYKRGYTNAAIPQYSLGMSDGGAFSSSLSYLYHFKTGVSYCAQGYQLIFNSSTTPFQFCMAKYDNNDEVGAQGDATALTYNQLLTSRGICSKYFSNDHSPVYPQRFARLSSISITTSTAFFNELKNNHWLDAKNYIKATSDSLAPIFVANPTLYPTYNSFNATQRIFVTDQIDQMYADHHFYDDLDKTSIHFLTSQCQ
ncbi:hypothetical protein F5148DRAFT_1292462 [Russula earlei]|uniref:Uncharacterized protein n=1 Tax=Russula earlei TaxID=71964 RepID=A0ACC0TUS9_9AGAM|nr:hypothetical protein F5148DRAFT_1292462 [Russula earlei]